MKGIAEQFLDILKARMEEKHISQSELAKRMGVSRQMVSLYLTGKSKAHSALMERFLNAVDLAPRLEVKPYIDEPDKPGVLIGPLTTPEHITQ